MKLPLFQVDAFTAKRFRGNPAAVVLLDEWLPDEVLQNIGAENNLSETAFLKRQGEDLFELRWFTPRLEVDLCGHATLASAFVVFGQGLVPSDTIRFETRSGTLLVHREEDLLRLDFPARPCRPTSLPPVLAEVLGAHPEEVFDSKRDLLTLFHSEEDVRSLRPDFTRLKELEVFGVIATAPGREADFVSRFFVPKAGIDEDPVTGSAHCVLVPFWSSRLGKRKLHAFQVSRRGGELFCEDKGDRVHLAGRCVEYLRGEILLD